MIYFIWLLFNYKFNSYWWLYLTTSLPKTVNWTLAQEPTWVGTSMSLVRSEWTPDCSNMSQSLLPRNIVSNEKANPSFCWDRKLGAGVQPSCLDNAPVKDRLQRNNNNLQRWYETKKDFRLWCWSSSRFWLQLFLILCPWVPYSLYPSNKFSITIELRMVWDTRKRMS